jgi:hypothetical protein
MHRPGETAPKRGVYEELNVFGSRTGGTIRLEAGDAFPAAPRGFVWSPAGETPDEGEDEA